MTDTTAAPIDPLNRIEAIDHELDRLKGLLLAGELATIQRLHDELAELRKRVGDDDAMQASVTRVMSASLAESHRRDPKVLTRVLSPLIVSGIQRQVKESADDLVEVMYPITGRLVAASVKASIRSLAESVNHQLETTFSPRGLLAVLRSKISGRPVADFLLAASASATMRRAMIVDKDSGKVNAQWQANGAASTDSDNPDNTELVTGLLAALNNLANEAFDDSAGGLRTLELDGRQVALRSSASQLLIVEIDGSLNAEAQSWLDAAYIEAIEHLEGDRLDAACSVMQDLAERFAPTPAVAAGAVRPESAQAPGAGFWTPGRTGVLAAAIAVFCVWPAKQWLGFRQLDRDVARIQSVLDADHRLTGFPIRVLADYR